MKTFYPLHFLTAPLRRNGIAANGIAARRILYDWIASGYLAMTSFQICETCGRIKKSVPICEICGQKI